MTRPNTTKNDLASPGARKPGEERPEFLPVEVGKQSGDQEEEEPLTRLGEFPQDGVPEEVFCVVVPGYRSEERPEPLHRVPPHRIEELVACHAHAQCKETDLPAVAVEEDAGEEDQGEDGEAVEVDPTVVDRPVEDDMPERLVDQVGEHGAQRGERENPPVAGDRRDDEPYEDTDHGMGDEVHR